VIRKIKYIWKERTWLKYPGRQVTKKVTFLSRPISTLLKDLIRWLVHVHYNPKAITKTEYSWLQIKRGSATGPPNWDGTGPGHFFLILISVVAFEIPSKVRPWAKIFVLERQPEWSYSHRHLWVSTILGYNDQNRPFQYFRLFSVIFSFFSAGDPPLIQ
jgi:hypothetical protein